ncbi:hypothetical protein M406DRAFT_334503 [Cryphonectria parasitica EP155]|uniref:Uncharacterized protein n=1 Tax=Cryphonectria parasitica (strain ATCC 38755 / EP155) TaxID=660469 RepID=A0A9P5CKK9_CRYP1|nr:uncharacterized protein M406DRAFT_334503 [Cryphonectria parasitica EP155]KAF3760880.1 hypothetical protein M406DRAFT_334503 [Cryphonectria parasitica EP155]
MSSTSSGSKKSGKWWRVWQRFKKKDVNPEVTFKADKWESATMIIWLGASWTPFNLGDATVGGISVDVDLQLAAIGLINKVMDTFVQSSLKHTASVVLTIWMAFGVRGAGLLDLELEKELTEPLTCIVNFYKRASLNGWKKLGTRDILRFLASLSVAFCVLLLGLAVNTIGIPKERWWPTGDTEGYHLTGSMREMMTITMPRTHFVSLDWNNYWNEAWEMIGSGPVSWDAAAAIVAASTYTLLSGIPAPYQQPDPGWFAVTTEIPGYMTGVNTVVNGSTVQTMSVQNSVVQDTFNYFTANGSHSFQRYANGWHAFLNLTVPMLTTTCTSGFPGNATCDGCIEVDGPRGESPTDSTLEVTIGAVTALNFTGVTCNMTFSQALYPVGSWIIDGAGVSVSLDNYGSNKGTKPLPLGPFTEDRTCAGDVKGELNSITSRMSGLLDSGIVYHMVLTARNLAYFNKNFSATDDARGMAPVIAVMAQHLVTIADWNTTTSSDPEETTVSFPIRWEIYASGPRMAWEWAAVVILVVVLLALLAGGLYGLVKGIEPGPWLEKGGIMLLANQSKPIDSAKESVGGEASEEAEEATYYVRDSTAAHDEPQLVLVDKKGANNLDYVSVDKNKVYNNTRHPQTMNWHDAIHGSGY